MNKLICKIFGHIVDGGNIIREPVPFINESQTCIVTCRRCGFKQALEL